MKKTVSLQSIHQQRRAEYFIGRESQIASFQHNLDLPYRNRQFIWSIYGQGGIGKTTLLKRFATIASRAGALTAITDESQDNVLDVLRSMAKQLEEQDVHLSNFTERYRKYRQLKQSVEGDPEAPAGISLILGKAIGRLSVAVARQVPMAGIAVDLLGEGNLVEQFGEYTRYIVRRITNKDEVALLLSPIEELTPLFVDDINQAANQRITLLGFDTYEQTSKFLDVWLHSVLDGRYGELSPDVLWVFAGRERLSSAWSDYVSLTAYLQLEPLSEAEQSRYLMARGISTEENIKAIIKLSGGIPLWLATLASWGALRANEIIDPSSQAVESFLKWADNEAQRRAALFCALPQDLNRDVVGLLVGTEEAPATFDWLKNQPFVQQNAGKGWVYHDLVRGIMLRYLRTESRHDWTALNNSLARFYLEQRDSLGLSSELGYGNRDWVAFGLARLYHKLLAEPEKLVPFAMAEYLVALDSDELYAQRLGETVLAVGQLLTNGALVDVGKRMLETVTSYFYGTSENAAIALLDQIEKNATLGGQELAIILRIRGALYERIDRVDLAIAEYTRALSVGPESSHILLRRAEAYFALKRVDDALKDCDRAIKISPDVAQHFVERAKFMRRSGRYDEALLDYGKAIDLEPSNEEFISDRASLLASIGREEDAVADYTRAIELKPDNVWLLTSRAAVFLSMHRSEESIIDLSSSIKLRPDHDCHYGYRADTLMELGRYEEAIQDYAKAIDFKYKPQNTRGELPRLRIGQRVIFLGPRDWYLRRGKAYQLLGKFDEALQDYKESVEREDVGWGLFLRATLLDQMNRHEEAVSEYKASVSECTRQIEEYRGIDRGYSADLAESLNLRSMAFEKLGAYDEAIEDLCAAVAADPEDARLYYRKYKVLTKLERYQDALESLDRFAERDSMTMTDLLTNRGLLYSYQGQYEQALHLFREEQARDPDSYAVAYNIAVALARWKGIDEACAVIAEARARIGKAAEYEENHAAVYYGLGGLASIEGSIDEALSYLGKSLSVDSRMAEWARHDTAWINLKSDERFCQLLRSVDSTQ